MKRLLTFAVSMFFGLILILSGPLQAMAFESAQQFSATLTDAQEVNEEIDPDVEEIPILSGKDYDYWINEDGTATLCKYKGEEKDVVVPTRIDGVTVSALGMEIFQYEELNSIVIPEGIETIGYRAFEYCTIAESLSLPEQISIGKDAFSYAQLPEIVTLPAGTTVGASAFSYCKGLAVLNVDTGSVMESRAFEYSKDLQFIVFAVESRIEERAFDHCNRLEQVYLCGPVDISSQAFAHSEAEIVRGVRHEFAQACRKMEEAYELQKALGPEKQTMYSTGSLYLYVPAIMEETNQPEYDIFLENSRDSYYVGLVKLPPTVLDFTDEVSIQVMLDSAAGYVNVESYELIQICGYPSVWMDVVSTDGTFFGSYLYIDAGECMYHLMFTGTNEDREPFRAIADTIEIYNVEIIDYGGV